MPKMIVRHKVRDFATWRGVFDAWEGRRAVAGLTDPAIYRGADDPNAVAVIIDAADLDRVRGFAASEAFAAAMREAGVIGTPEVLVAA